VGPEVREEGEEDVDATEETYHCRNENDAPSDRPVDGEEEIDETGEEEEDGYVEQGR
jgi:hypothetical protein